MPQTDFDTFRTYIEEAEGEEVPEPTADQLASVEFWWNIGNDFVQYVDRRIEDPEPFEWYEHFLDKTIEAFQYAHQLMQQTQTTNIMIQTFLPRDLAQSYAHRGRLNMAQGAYDAAFLDFDAAVSYQPEAEYQKLRAEALSHLPSE